MEQGLKRDLSYIAHMARKAPGYEHAKLLDIDSEDLKDRDFLHSELREKRAIGTVISTYRDENGNLHYIIDPLSHVVMLGSTGTGKSSLVLKAQIIAMAESGVASMVVVDVKGALYEQLCAYLKDLGYNVRLIHLNAPDHSEGWNPHTIPAQKFYDDMSNFGKDVKCKQVGKKTVYLYKGTTYSKKELSIAFEREMKCILRDMKNSIKSIHTKFFPHQLHEQKFWENGARAMFDGLAIGLILDMFALNEKRRTTVQQVNFANMREVFESFAVRHTGIINDRGFFTDRQKSIAYTTVKNVFFEDAQVTVRNHLAFTSDNFARYDENFYEITRATTFSTADSINSKTVDFIVYDEGDTVNTDFVGAFFASDLEQSRKIADSMNNQMLECPRLYLIDEFASLPRCSNVEKHIATLRSRNIFLWVVIQSDSQLVSSYDKAAATILNNCNTTIYLGTGESSTIERISRDLGKQTIPSPASAFGGAVYLEERPLVTCSQLSLFNLGEAYVRRMGKHTLKAHYEKSWECPEYDCPHVKLNSYVSELSKKYGETLYDPDVIQPEPDDEDEDDDDLF